MSSGTRPGDAPRGRPTAVSVAVVVCLALVALAVVAVHDLAAAQGWLSGPPWVRQALDALDGTTVGPGVVVAGVAAIVVGLLVLLAALAPGRRTHLAVRTTGTASAAAGSTTSELWISPRALAHLATGVADRAEGVLDARTASSSLSKVVVEVTTGVRASGTDAVAEAQAAVDAQTRDLTDATVVVRPRKEKR